MRSRHLKRLIEAAAILSLLVSSGFGSSLKADEQDAGPEPFERAMVQGAIGEASHLFLIRPGIYFHPIYNDVTGATDKLLTASAKLGYLGHYSSRTSLEVVTFRRLLTPVVKPAFLKPDLPTVVGRYADWSEFKSAVAQTIDVSGSPLKLEASLGLSHIGDKGGREFHRWVHRVTKNSLENLEYTNQPEGRFASYGFGLSTWWSLTESVALASGLRFETSRMMQELALAVNGLWTIHPTWWVIATEVRGVRQFESEAYGRVKPFRYEAALGARVLRWYTPTVKYVAAYLSGDRYGQTYFDFLHLNFSF